MRWSKIPAMRYQQGTLEEVSTAAGICWYIRFTNPKGVSPARPRYRVGLKKQYPSKAVASRAAQHLRDKFNESPEEILSTARTFGDVIDRYEREEMPERFSTARGYQRLHRVHIRPQWGEVALSEISPMQVREWLRKMECASRTKGHIHGQMRVLFRFAMLWGWVPAQVNPMSLFSIPGSTKRERTPKVIPAAVFLEMLTHTPEANRRAMLTGAYCLGLRVSELFGLQWGDFDWLGGEVRIRRGVVRSRVGKVKTERSDAALPLAKPVADAFLAWLSEATYREPSDWVFASGKKAGLAPMSPERLQQRFLEPLGKTMKLPFSVGWHSLRHSYKSLLDRAVTDSTTKRDLMRHADIKTTEQVYGAVEMDRMRAANLAALELIFPGTGDKLPTESETSFSNQ